MYLREESVTYAGGGIFRGGLIFVSMFEGGYKFVATFFGVEKKFQGPHLPLERNILRGCHNLFSSFEGVL